MLNLIDSLLAVAYFTYAVGLVVSAPVLVQIACVALAAAYALSFVHKLIK